jgi:uncharacterized protein (TIGR02058 family)
VSTTRYVLEFGMGVDLHGQDWTKAARRAVFDALRHSSLPLLQEIRARGGVMVVEATIGVADPGSVDLDAVKSEFPHGKVTVRAVSGGLSVPGAETAIACAAVIVSGEYPD